MADAPIAVLATVIGVLILLKSGLISREVISFQQRAGRDIGGPYERLAASPESTRAHDRHTRVARALVVLVGLTWVGLGTVGLVTSV